MFFISCNTKQFNNSNLSNNNNKIEGEGFLSPKMAVKSYIQAMQNGNVQKMIASFAIESYIEQYKLEEFLLQMTVYNYNMSSQSFPNTNNYTKTFNLIKRQNSISNKIAIQYIILTSHQELEALRLKRIKTEKEAMVLIDELGGSQNLEIMQSAHLVEFINPMDLSEYYDREATKKFIQQQQKVLGCQDLQSIVAKVNVNNKNYYFCFDVGRYNNKWYIINLNGVIGTLLGSVSGIIEI